MMKERRRGERKEEDLCERKEKRITTVSVKGRREQTFE